jgi:hypothetical protein
MASRFFVRDSASDEAAPIGPVTADELGDLVASGEVSLGWEARPEDGSVWAPAVSWAALELPATPPPKHAPESLELPDEVRTLDDSVRDGLRWWLRDGGKARGPLDGVELREQLLGQIGASTMVAMVGGSCWFPRSAFERISAGPWRAIATSAAPPVRCPACLEEVSSDCDECPECEESFSGPMSSSPAASIPDLPPGASWLKLHWRPALMFSAVAALLISGLILRQLAPQKKEEVAEAPAPAATVPTCQTACWHGEACEAGACVWKPRNDAGHIATEKLSITGPFELPKDFTDVLPLDDQRFAVSELVGVRIHNAGTGAELSLVSDAPHGQQLHRVRGVVYATAPHRIYVIDASSVRVRKTIELGGSVGDLVVGAEGRRVLASLPSAKALVVLASEYHAEVARFFFGDLRVRPVAIDDTGTRALTTNGRVPLSGLRAPRNAVRDGAMYAFDPSRLPSEQDKVRTGLVGNPVDILMVPDAVTSYVLLREKDTIVRLQRLDSGAIRQEARFETCRQPEQIELIRRGRRAIVRCGAGRALEVIDLEKGKLLRRIALNARAADMVVSPDAANVLLTLPRDGESRGAVGVLDLESYELSTHELGGEPNRIRLSPDGRTAVVISDRSKATWVIR